MGNAQFQKEKVNSTTQKEKKSSTAQRRQEKAAPTRGTQGNAAPPRRRRGKHHHPKGRTQHNPQGERMRARKGSTTQEEAWRKQHHPKGKGGQLASFQVPLAPPASSLAPSLQGGAQPSGILNSAGGYSNGLRSSAQMLVCPAPLPCTPYSNPYNLIS